MIPDVVTGDPTLMMCIHCARKTVSPKSRAKYEALTRYLKFRASFTNIVKLSLAEIDGIIGDNLPITAYRKEEWWKNSPDKPHSNSWLEAGWKTHEVNIKEGYIIFQKAEDTQRRGISKTPHDEVKKPFTPAPVRHSKGKKPSKTRLTKLHARLKNLERQRTSTPKYHGSLKPKPTYEKKLYNPNEKPQ